MDNAAHDAIMKEYKKHLTSSYTRGVVVGLKLGANYVAEKLGNPEEWVGLDTEALMTKLSDGVAMAESIRNGKLGTYPVAMAKDETPSEIDESIDETDEIESSEE